VPRVCRFPRLLRLARHDAARGALRSAEHLLATAAGAGSSPAPAVIAEQVTVLTLVGRAADALALGAAELDGLHGDAHAELCLQLARTAVTAGAWDDAEAYVARAGRPGDPRSLVLRLLRRHDFRRLHVTETTPAA